jgi:hypothetical protein
LDLGFNFQLPITNYPIPNPSWRGTLDLEGHLNLDIALVFLKRSVQMVKEEWRLPSTRRTLDPITVGPPVCWALRAWRSNPISPAILETEISLDGGEIQTPVVRMAKQTDYSGVFHVQFVDRSAKIRIQQEACRKELHTPRRSTQHLATLALWKPMRVLLNGKYDYYEGVRFYLLQDYHIVLCDDADNAESQLCSSTRLFDLQADLI